MLVGSVAWVIGMAGYERVARSNEQVRYLVLSNRPESEDYAIKAASLLGAHVTYARQESDFGRAMLREVKIARAPDLVLIIDHGGGQKLLTEVDRDKIIAILEKSIPSHKPRMPGFAVAALIGLWIGMLGSRLVYLYAPWILALSAASAGWKWVHACASCAEATIAGVDAALLGLVIFSLATFAAAFRRNKEHHLFIVILACILATWQVFTVLSSASVSCVSCAVICATNFSLIGAYVFSKSSYRVTVQNPWSTATIATSLVATITLVSATLASGPASVPQISPNTKLNVGQFSWQGVNLREIGINLNIKLDKPTLLFVGKKTCLPCRQAKKYLDTHHPFPYVYLELPLAGQTAKSLCASFTHRPNVFRQVPTFIAVSRSGTILYTGTGWSSDDLWIKASLDNINRTLQLAARSKNS